MSNALGIMLICIGIGVFVYQLIDSEISRKEMQKLSLSERVRLNYKSTKNKYMIGGNKMNKMGALPAAIAMLGVYLLKGNEDKKKK